MNDRINLCILFTVLSVAFAVCLAGNARAQDLFVEFDSVEQIEPGFLKQDRITAIPKEDSDPSPDYVSLTFQIAMVGDEIEILGDEIERLGNQIAVLFGLIAVVIILVTILIVAGFYT